MTAYVPGGRHRELSAPLSGALVEDGRREETGAVRCERRHRSEGHAPMPYARTPVELQRPPHGAGQDPRPARGSELSMRARATSARRRLWARA